MALPSNCAPDGPHVDRDIGEFVKTPEGFVFTPRDSAKPAGGPPFAHLTDPKAAAEDELYGQVLNRMKEYTVEGKGGAYPNLGTFYRIPREYYKDVERETGVPVFRWYLAIEDARRNMEVDMAPLLASLRKIGMTTSSTDRQQAFLHWEAGNKAASPAAMTTAATERQAQLADLMFGAWKKWLVDTAKFTDEAVDQFFKELPVLRSMQGDTEKFFAQGRGISVPMTRARLALTQGEIHYDSRELEPLKVIQRLSLAIMNENHLSPMWRMIDGQIKLFEQSGVRFNPLLGAHFQSYLAEVKHMPDALSTGLARAWNGMVQRLPIKEKWSIPENLDLAGRFASVNYFANMAWNVGFVMRNYLQSLLPMATVGFEHGGPALKIAGKWLRGDAALREKYLKLGVTSHDVLPQVEKEVTDGLNALQYSTKVQKFFSWAQEHGQSAFKASEGFNRVAAFEMGRAPVERFAPEYISGKISWEEFLEKSKLDMRDAKGGPLHSIIKDLLDKGGNVEEAANTAGRELMYSTQFMYSRGNNPYFMQSTAGRLLGQYGTWPTWFVEHLRGMATRGSVKNRLAAMTRFMAINAAVFEAGKEVFGVDTGKWTFFSPLGYQGGPLMQIGMHGAAAIGDWATPGPPDTVAALQSARLKLSFDQGVGGFAQSFMNSDYSQLTPLPWSAIRNISRSASAIGDEDWKTAAKRLLGFTPSQ